MPLLFVLAVSAAATPTPTRKLKHASGPIVTLAMDGARVVYSTQGNRVYVWNIRTGATSRVRDSSSSTYPIVQEVAIAGTRVAWITRDVAGNSQDTNEDLYTASLNGGTKLLAHAFRYWDFTENHYPLWRGDWIGGLVGSGRVLVVSRWTTTPNDDTGAETISNARLSLVSPGGGRLHLLLAGEQSIVSRSADAGRVAVLRPDESVGIYSAAGVLLRQIEPSSAQEISMGGGHLVVLTKTKTLEVYDVKTGALTHSWPFTIKGRLQPGYFRAYGRLALFSVGHSSRNLRIVDLRTGRGIALPSIVRSAWSDASVGPLGVVYAVSNGKAYGGHIPSGTLVFLSTSRVLADISRGHL
ncbi:MAG TPA: hypothetical protein VLU96_08520 [Gaiellaceae bacterium]|nr:hypothetical protein [Gaiellaceae bacterium]